jgi:SNF2 family DNA or RNA helicase
MKGEKVLIFCHYIATGKCLRQYISNYLNNYIHSTAAKKLDCDISETEKKLDNISKRFSTKDSQFMIAFENELSLMIKEYHTLKEVKSNVIEIIKRYVRTPSFIVRFFPLDTSERFSADTLIHALRNKDLSGITLRDTIREFFNFLEYKCGQDEREKYVGALLDIQTGNILSSDARAFLKDDEIQGERTERLIPNVRLVNGDTKSKTRQDLMLTFNTPFYPDILVTSSVLAEGVDLHLNCRFIIHHDLSWNPSTLEQRTGRIDRIGSKTERSGKSINVFLPYVSETQDEKMYRVVMDREKWFKIVMGEKYKVDVKSTDKLSERIPLPRGLTEELAFNLEI